ncbi:unnamed protein product [Ambrosiozyma monospora]|uniref:Unnamed protein product n=1 Tax=Ambrosiozyma monospora TaxID=43982 RepID=A0A9W6YZJ7_AMBMO|nr:unnamed protein product [Ambrosiozyma monospora]
MESTADITFTVNGPEAKHAAFEPTGAVKTAYEFTADIIETGKTCQVYATKTLGVAPRITAYQEDVYGHPVFDIYFSPEFLDFVIDGENDNSGAYKFIEPVQFVDQANQSISGLSYSLDEDNVFATDVGAPTTASQYSVLITASLVTEIQAQYIYTQTFGYSSKGYSTNLKATVTLSETPFPTVFAYQNGTNGWFEVDIPATLAPFSVDVSAGNFEFNGNSWYIDVDTTADSVGVYNGNGMYTTGGYSYGGPADGSNIQVGFGVSVAQNMSGVRELSADFHVYPRMNKNQKRDNNNNKATASFNIPALFTYSAFPLVADLHGGVPDSGSGSGSGSVSTSASASASASASDSSSSSANPGQSASVIPATESPAITVDISYNGIISNVHLSAINDDLQYLSGGETFYGNNLYSTQIDVAGGKFDAHASLSANSIQFVATAENDDQTMYTAVVSAEVAYDAVMTAFLPTETDGGNSNANANANDNAAQKKKKFAKRQDISPRTFKATASTTLSQQISHSTLTSTSTSPITTTSHTTPTATSTSTPTPTTSTSSHSNDNDSDDNSGSLSYSATYNKDGSIDVAIFADAAIKKHGSLSYSASGASNFKFSSASSGSTDGDFTISGVEIDKNSGASFVVSVSSGSGKKLVKRASWDCAVSLNAVGGTSSSSSSSITTTSAKSTSSSSSSNGNGNGKTTVSSSSSAGAGVGPGNGSGSRKDATSSLSADDSSNSGSNGSNGNNNNNNNNNGSNGSNGNNNNNNNNGSNGSNGNNNNNSGSNSSNGNNGSNGSNGSNAVLMAPMVTTVLVLVQMVLVLVLTVQVLMVLVLVLTVQQQRFWFWFKWFWFWF